MVNYSEPVFLSWKDCCGTWNKIMPVKERAALPKKLDQEGRVLGGFDSVLTCWVWSSTQFRSSTGIQ